MTGTQEALYAEIDLELSWSESALPQSERTKHVHGLHPYLGKFPPQLAEALIRRHCPEGGLVLDPFCGSGTTLVEAVGLGRDAVGCDISAFNALLSREKTRRHDAAAGRRRARRDPRARREPRERGARPTSPPIWPSGTARKRGASCWPIAARSSRTDPGAGSPRSC